ncbi:MAG: hypothetical protein HY810_02345 [Candidatus Omnitrophica bacterium]|nr:hypothetical protein [Candidatus Omnitrophota bacterium]
MAWIIYVSFFVRHGLSLTDAGLICAQSWRFYLGDIPFKDVFCIPVSLSDYFLSIVFVAYPDCGLLALRIIWAIILFIAIAFSYKIITRFYSVYLAFPAMICSLSIFAMHGIDLPGYNNTPEMFFIISIFLLFWSLCSNHKQKIFIYGVLSGFAAFTAVLCKVTYLPIAGIGFICLLVSLLIKSEVKKHILCASLIFTMTFFVSLAAFLIFLYVNGLFEEFLMDFRVHTQGGAYSSIIISGLFGKGSIFLLKALPLVISCIFFNLVCGYFLRKKMIFLRIGCQAILVCLFYLFFLRMFSFPGYFIYGYAYALLGVGIILYWKNIFEEKDKDIIVTNQLKIILLLLAGFLQWLCTLYSSHGIYTSHKGMFLSLPLAWIISWELPVYIKKAGQLNKKELLSYRIVILVFALIIAFYAFGFKLKHPYLDSPDRSELCVAFKTKKLKGIFSTKKHVEIIDRLTEFMGTRIKRGEYLLTYINLPMISFLLEARPATRITWFSGISNPLDKPAVEDLKKTKPKFVIRTHQYMCSNTWPDKVNLLLDAPGSEVFYVDNYVQANYELVNKIDAFEILQRNDEYFNEELNIDNKISFFEQDFYVKNDKHKFKINDFFGEKAYDFSVSGKRMVYKNCYKFFKNAGNSDFSFKLKYYPQRLTGFADFNVRFKALTYVLYGRADYYYPANEIIDGKVYACRIIEPQFGHWKELRVDSIVADYEKISRQLQGPLYDEMEISQVMVSLNSRAGQDSSILVYLADFNVVENNVDYARIDNAIKNASVYSQYGIILFNKRHYVDNKVMERCVQQFEKENVIRFSEPRLEGQLVFTKEYQNADNSYFSFQTEYFPEKLQGITKFNLQFELLDNSSIPVGNLTYVLYGKSDYYCNVNQKINGNIFATYIINPQQGEWKNLVVNSLTDDYNNISTRLGGKLWQELNISKIKVLLFSFGTQQPDDEMSVCLKRLEIKKNQR